MKKITFVINGIEVSTRLNDNSELGKEKLLEDTKDLIKDDQEAIVKAVMALPRDQKSTVSQYRVLLENVVVDGVPSKTNLVKLAASLISDASMKLAVRESHYKNKSGSSTEAVTALQEKLDKLHALFDKAPLEWLIEAPKDLIAEIPGLGERIQKMETIKKMNLSAEQTAQLIALL